MATEDLTAMPAPASAGGMRAIAIRPVEDQPRPIPGIRNREPEARPPAEPDWRADALIPLDGVPSAAYEAAP